MDIEVTFLDEDRDRAGGQGDGVGKGRQRDIRLQSHLEANDVRIDQGIHFWMKHKVGHMEIGKDDLVEKPGKVPDKTEDLDEMASFYSFFRKEKVTGDQGDQSAGDDPKEEMEKVKHTREKDPEREQDDESCKKNHWRSRERLC